MTRRFLVFATLALLCTLVLGFYFNRAHGEAKVLFRRSIPAVRVLGDLRDLLARVQISVLETSGLEADARVVDEGSRRLQLEQAATLFERYRATIVSKEGLELSERVAAALAHYRTQVDAFEAASLDAASRTTRARACSLAFAELHRELAALREYRLSRVEDRIENMDRAARRGWRTNLVTLGLLVVAMLLTWVGIQKTAHDAHQ
jgi:hypothetical protein